MTKINPFGNRILVKPFEKVQVLAGDDLLSIPNGT